MDANDSKLTKEEIQILFDLDSNMGKKNIEERWGAQKIHKLINAGYLEEVGLIFKEISLTDKGQNISKTKHANSMDKVQTPLGTKESERADFLSSSDVKTKGELFDILTKTNGFDKVKCEEDGGCRFERHYFFKTVTAKVDKKGKIIEYK